MKKVFFVILAFFFIFVPAGCSNAGMNEGNLTITDMVGRKVTVNPGSYKRVVCVGAGALRMYCYIGDIDKLCAIEDIDNESLSQRPSLFDASPRPYVIANSEAFKKLPSCGTGGPNAQVAEAEKILLCNPDLIISEYEDATKSDALQKQLGVPVITLKTGQKLGEGFDNALHLLATVLDKKQRAEELTNYYNSELLKISERTAKIAEEDKLYAYIGGLGNWGTTNHLTTSQSYAPFITAGIKNVISGLATDGPCPIEKEVFEVVGAKTDVMIIDEAAVKNITKLLKEDADLFKNNKAVKNNRVFLQIAYNCYYTNFESLLIDCWIDAKAVYPDIFQDIDIEKKINEITKAFLGKELAPEILQYAKKYGGYDRFDINSLT